MAEIAEWRSNRDNDAVKRSLDELALSLAAVRT